MRKIYLVSLVCALTACVSGPTAISPSSRIIGTDRTADGEILHSDVGSVFLEKSELSMLPAIQITKPYKVPKYDRVVIPPQFAVAYWDKSKVRRYTVRAEIIAPAGEVRDSIFVNLALDLLHSYLEGEENYLDMPVATISGKWLEPNLSGSSVQAIRHEMTDLPSSWSLTESKSSDHDNYRQTLTYLGHGEEGIRILYQEYVNDFIRDRFSLEINYDISSDKTLGFRGARVEVLEAGNQQISYRVLEPFPNVQSGLPSK